ncbi:MAG: DNA-processing protein DprA [Fimbriimonas sp.]
MRRAGCTYLESAPEILAHHGLWYEATILQHPLRLAWAEKVCELGGAMSVVDDAYPAAWFALGAQAPPVLWKVGEVPEADFIGVVGSRNVPEPVLGFAYEVAKQAVFLGYGVVSGGASGCDAAAARGARGQVLEILPYGVRHHRGGHPALALAPPDEPFSAALAMERNALIYAASRQTIVVHSRFREGGTWVGATDALRRRLCPLLVRDDPESQAHRALMALGARSLREPSELADALRLPGLQPSLMSA